MVYITAPLFLLVSLVSLVAAWFGLTYLIGPWIGFAAMALFLFFRITWWIVPCAFVGAFYVWHWPWYGAAAIAAPGLMLMIPVAAAVFGNEAIERFKRKKST